MASESRERTVDEMVEDARYAREHAVASAALPSVLVTWVKSLADDVESLAAVTSPEAESHVHTWDGETDRVLDVHS